jgi:hypothetical protein
LYVNKEPIITNPNQAYFAELGTRGLQEGVFRKGGENNTSESSLYDNFEG